VVAGEVLNGEDTIRREAQNIVVKKIRIVILR
jgi:hypothetical protein